MGNTERSVAGPTDDAPPRSGLAPRAEQGEAARSTVAAEAHADHRTLTTASGPAGPLPQGGKSRRETGLRLTFGHKLAIFISCLQLAIIGSLALFFEHIQASALNEELRDKADTYAQLVAAQIRSAVAFEDRETAREVFDAVSTDPDLLAAVLFDQSGRILHSWGNPGKVASSARGGVESRQVFELPDRTLSVAPVISLEGPRGTLTLEFSKRQLETNRHQLHRLALVASGLALLVATCLAFFIAQSFSRRLRAIASTAERVAAGELTLQPARDATGDEVGSLARSFGVMLEQIKRLFNEAAQRAAEEQTRLEGLVQARTRALEDRNADMRRVLDNVEQGFLTIDGAGTMSQERSAIVERWFGPAPASGSFFEYIDAAAPGMGSNLQICWSEVVDGFLPVELSLAQMPRSFSKDGQHFAIEYHLIFVGNRAGGAVVVLSDVTPLVHKERAEAAQREALRVFTCLLEDRAGVVEFFADAARLVHQISVDTPDDQQITKRLLHTLKGNASAFGIERLSRLCHEIEDTMSETGSNIGNIERRRLAESWTTIHENLAHLVEGPGHAGFIITERDCAELTSALETGRSAAQVLELVESWRLEPTEVRLERAARQAGVLAERLGKNPIDVRVEANRVRLDPEHWSLVWAELPHLIRNAIDHGIEAPSERKENGKPEVATLWLRTLVDGGRFAIEVEDSGRGVDWESLRRRARARGLPADSAVDLECALFADGLSTKDTVGENSGRGVGMSAVKAAVQTRGGHIHVHSEPLRGTRVRLSWPASAMNSCKPARRSAPVAHESSGTVSNERA